MREEKKISVKIPPGVDDGLVFGVRGRVAAVEVMVTLNRAAAEAMVEAAVAAERRGVYSMVGFNYRLVPALALARKLACGEIATRARSFGGES